MCLVLFYQTRYKTKSKPNNQPLNEENKSSNAQNGAKTKPKFQPKGKWNNWKFERIEGTSTYGDYQEIRMQEQVHFTVCLLWV